MRGLSDPRHTVTVRLGLGTKTGDVIREVKGHLNYFELKSLQHQRQRLYDTYPVPFPRKPAVRFITADPGNREWGNNRVVALTWAHRWDGTGLPRKVRLFRHETFKSHLLKWSGKMSSCCHSRLITFGMSVHLILGQSHFWRYFSWRFDW